MWNNGRLGLSTPSWSAEGEEKDEDFRAESGGRLLVTQDTAAGGTQAVRRALAILRILAAGGEAGARIADVSEQTGMDRSTVHRILQALVDEGAAEQDADSRRYLIGQDIAVLGITRTARLQIATVAEPHLRRLARTQGDTVVLIIRSGGDAVCIDCLSGSYPAKIQPLEVGTRRPLGASAGLVFLARMAPEEAEALYRVNASRYRALGVDMAELRSLVAEARASGYALRRRDFAARRSLALGVHVEGASGEAVAALGYLAIAERMPPERIPVLVADLREAAARIARKLIERDLPIRRAEAQPA